MGQTMDGSDEQSTPQPIKPDEEIIYVDGSMVTEYSSGPSAEVSRSTGPAAMASTNA